MEGWRNTYNRILSSLGALFLFCIYPFLNKKKMPLFYFTPCGCLSLASWYCVHILAPTFLRAEERQKKEKKRGAKAEPWTSVWTCKNLVIVEFVAPSCAFPLREEERKSYHFFLIEFEFILVPSEDNAAGRRVAERLPLSDLTRSRPVSKEVIKQHSSMASPLVKELWGIFLPPDFLHLVLHWLDSFCTFCPFYINLIMSVTFRSSNYRSTWQASTFL